MLPSEGQHQAKLNGQIIIYETDAGALCAAVPVQLLTEGVSWGGKHTATLVKQDGTVNTRTLDNFKKLFGSGPDDASNKIYRFAEDPETPLSEIEGADAITFEIVGAHEDYTPEGESEPVRTFKVKWLNPIGGGTKMPEPIDRKSVLAKYGAKFRALGGGKPEAAKVKPAAKPAAAPAKATAPAAAPKAQAKSAPKGSPADDPLAPTATMEEAWETLCNKNPDLDEKAAGELFFAEIEKHFPGKTNETLKLKEWGKLKTVLADGE
jgi:hypothetical protein